MINEFKHDQTWKIWPSSLSFSLYSTFKYKIAHSMHFPLNLSLIIP